MKQIGIRFTIQQNSQTSIELIANATVSNRSCFGMLSCMIQTEENYVVGELMHGHRIQKH